MVQKDRIAFQTYIGTICCVKQCHQSSTRIEYLCEQFSSFDIYTADREVKQRDTIKSFPKGFEVSITNPPWLTRNSATRKVLPFAQSNFDDLYKHCLDLCIRHCIYVAALVPASFLEAVSGKTGSVHIAS